MLITAHQFFKGRHPRILAWASMVALSLIVLAFLYSPAFRVDPYRLPETVIPTLVPPPEIIVPLPPPDIPMPRVPVHIEVVEGPGSEVELAPSNVDFDGEPPPPPSLSTRESELVVVPDQLPELIHHAPVSYPEMAREAEMEGEVLVMVDVDRRGRVTDARVINSTVTSILEQAALEAAWKCTFRPGKQRNVPVPTRAVLPFEFRIRR